MPAGFAGEAGVVGAGVAVIEMGAAVEVGVAAGPGVGRRSLAADRASCARRRETHLALR